MLLGMSRGRYYLLTGKEIVAAEALEWGLAGEVVAAGSELPRAREVARLLAAQPALVRRYTREVITLEVSKRRLRDELGYGLALERLACGYGNWREDGPAGSRQLAQPGAAADVPACWEGTGVLEGGRRGRGGWYWLRPC
jgi:enoyl-CoA hydratase/carnithine racemase